MFGNNDKYPVGTTYGTRGTGNIAKLIYDGEWSSNWLAGFRPMSCRLGPPHDGVSHRLWRADSQSQLSHQFYVSLLPPPITFDSAACDNTALTTWNLKSKGFCI